MGKVIQNNRSYSTGSLFCFDRVTTTNPLFLKLFVFFICCLVLLSCVLQNENELISSIKGKRYQKIKALINSTHNIDEPFQSVKYLENEKGERILVRGFRLLDLAIELEDLELLQLCLELGCGIDYLDRFGQSPLMKACTKKDLRMVEIILDYGASVEYVDSIGSTAVHYSVKRGNEELLSLLLKEKPELANVPDDFGYTPLMLSLLGDEPEDWSITCVILQYGGNPCFKTKLGSGIDVAMGSGNCNLVDLLEEKIKTDCRSENHLDVFCFAKTAKTSSSWIESFNPNSLNYELSNPLTVAVANENIFAIQFLLKKGCTVNHANMFGKSSLFYVKSTEKGREILEILLRNGADINHTDLFKETILFEAVRNMDLELVKFLLKMGADPLLVNDIGNTPLSLAEANDELSEILKNGKKKD